MGLRKEGEKARFHSGAESEAQVALDLLRQGYDVFSPVVAYGTQCDLIAMNRQTGATLRIEVKTVRSSRRTGRLYDPAKGTLRYGKYDVLAKVSGNRVEYTPELSPSIPPSVPPSVPLKVPLPDFG